MLIEFRVKNFRSIRDEQVFSLVASKDKTLQDTHTAKTNMRSVPRLLRSAVIYGANASGKSNLIKAIQYMQSVVLDSATVIQQGQNFNVQPFLMDPECSNNPTEFEVIFIKNDIRYQYGFSMLPERIINEYLLVYKTFKPQTWFTRYFDEKKNQDEYTFGSAFRGEKDIFKKTTRQNALFLSTAVQLNNVMLREVFDWFKNDLIIFNEYAKLNPKISIQMLQQPDLHKDICLFLNNADITLEDILIEKQKVTAQALQFDLSTGKAEVKQEDIEEHKITFQHVAKHGNVGINIKDESSGTRNLLFLAGPILSILKKGLTLIVDELDTSLHTMLVRQLIRMFHSNERNIENAQLIFTTHDVSLLNETDLFRRDQVWFVEKNNDQATTLTELVAFSPRKNEALEKGYLIGRYGGIPFLHNDVQ